MIELHPREIKGSWDRGHVLTLTKVKSTPQLKDIGDFSARTIALEAAFAADRNLEGKDVLLLDDLFSRERQ